MKTLRPFYLLLFTLMISGNINAQIFLEDFNTTSLGSFGSNYTMVNLSDNEEVTFFTRSPTSRNSYVSNDELSDIGPSGSGIQEQPENHDGSKAISFANLSVAYGALYGAEGMAIVSKSIDISSFEDLNIGLKVTATNGERNQYDVDEGLDIQYELDNSGVWITVGQFRGKGISPIFNNPYTYFYEDADLDGEFETQTGPDFRSVSYNLNERSGTDIIGRTMKLRVAFYSGQEAEGSFDDLILTGTPIPPSISFTKKDESCDGDRDGEITASVNFGAEKYTYVLNNRIIAQNTNDTSITIDQLTADTYTLKVIDSNGDEDEQTITIAVAPDVEAPTIFEVADQTQDNGECSAELLDYTLLTLAFDNCDGSPVITQSPVVGTMIFTGTTLVTLTATDESGNRSTTTFNVTLRDETKPKVELFSTQTQELGNSCSVALADYTGLIVATDNCDDSPVVTQVPAPGTMISEFTALTVSVTDASGNVGKVIFGVKLEDVTAPVIECPSDVLIESTEELMINYNDPEVTENCTIDKVELISGLESGSEFPFGTSTQEFEVSDASGNTASCSFTVTVDRVTGINDKLEANQLFYPNPSNGTLSFSGETPDEIIIKQLNGTVVTEMGQIQNPVVLESLPESVYLLEVYTNGKVDFHKISIVK